MTILDLLQISILMTTKSIFRICIYTKLENRISQERELRKDPWNSEKKRNYDRRYYVQKLLADMF